MNKKLIALSLSTLLLLTACGEQKEYRTMDEVKAEKAEQKAIEYAKKTDEEKIELFIKEEIGKKTNMGDKRIKEIKKKDNGFDITLKADESMTPKSTRISALSDASELFGHLKKYEGERFTVIFLADLVDVYGNVNEGEILRITMERENLDKVNFDKFDYNKFDLVSRHMFVHPAIK